jgi:crossover junction endodeoxyribonuclease RuvC
MRLLSIDPGYDKTGFAVFESSHSSKTTFLRSGIIKTTPKQSIDLRLKVILEVLETVIADDQIDTMVMEQLFFFKNAKTVIGVAQAQGAIISLAAHHGLSFHFLTPLQIKQIVTGDGRADKAAVWKMLKLELGDNLRVSDDDESDAIACGYAWCVIKRA